MSSGNPPPNHVVAVVGVVVVSLLCAFIAFQVVVTGRSGQDRSSSAVRPAAAPRASARSTTGTKPRSTSIPPARTLARRVTATGQQLGAAAPLGDVKQDQGSTIQLPDGRTLWIFADTFQLHNDPRFFITSAAALSNPGSWQLQYSLGAPNGDKRPPAEFLPRTPAESADRVANDHYQAVWPTGSTQLPDGRIIISYAKYLVHLDTRTYDFLGAGLFEFKYRGVKRFMAGAVARRTNDMWTIYDGEVRSPIYADGYVYFSQCQNLSCYSLRTTPDGINDRSAYRWWTGNGWSRQAGMRTAVTVGSNHPGGNPSIVRLKNGVYAMADTSAGGPSTTGHFWVAPHPWGPWSAAASYRMPNCPNNGCYGLNLHPELSTGTSLRVSYATVGVGPWVRVDDVPVKVDPDGSWITVT